MTKPGQDKQYYIGIEATGRTIAILADETGEIIGEGVAPPAVYSLVGADRTERAMWMAVMSAFSGAGFTTRNAEEAQQVLPDVKSICVGMSGIERPKDESAIKRMLGKFNLFEKILVVSEAQIVLEAASQVYAAEDERGWGVAALSGDSSLAFGCSQQGKTALAGSWGYILGEDASAFAIGLQAVRAVLRAADGRGEATTLGAMLAREWKIPENRPDSLSQRVYSLLAGLGTGGNKAQLEESVDTYKRTLSLLAPYVERAAAAGDEVAGEILDEAASQLATAVQAVITRTELTSPDKIPLALYGSLLLSNTGELRQRLYELLPMCDTPLSVFNPAEGALRLARLEAAL